MLHLIKQRMSNTLQGDSSSTPQQTSCRRYFPPMTGSGCQMQTPSRLLQECAKKKKVGRKRKNSVPTYDIVKK